MKKSVERNSRKNFTAVKTSKNNFLNIILIVLFILAVLFIVKIVFYKSVLKSAIEVECESVDGDGNCAGTSAQCKTSADCYTGNDQCTMTCVGGKCLRNGMILCSDNTPRAGDCVNSKPQCGCEQDCDICTQICNENTGQCEKKLDGPSFKCPNGDCVLSKSYCDLSSHTCDPQCGNCKKCAIVEYDEEDKPKYDCIIDNAQKECKNADGSSSGFCVLNGDLCPSDCSPACDSCLEVCLNEDGNKICKSAGQMKICSDGSCRRRDSPCPTIDFA